MQKSATVEKIKVARKSLALGEYPAGKGNIRSVWRGSSFGCRKSSVTAIGMFGHTNAPSQKTGIGTLYVRHFGAALTVCQINR